MRGRKPDANAVRRGVHDSYELATVTEHRGVVMPEDIAADPVRSEIWGWIAPPVNNFCEQDIPNLKLLVYWHAVAAQAQAVLTSPRGDGAIAIMERIGTKPFSMPDGSEAPLRRKNPALQVLKEASAEIRALSDMLGLSPLARSRIGLINASTVKTAAETAAMFATIDAAYELPEGAYDA